MNATSFMEVGYHPVHTAPETLKMTRKAMVDTHNDYVDAILYDKTRGAVVTARFTNRNLAVEQDPDISESQRRMVLPPRREHDSCQRIDGDNGRDRSCAGLPLPIRPRRLVGRLYNISGFCPLRSLGDCWIP